MAHHYSRPEFSFAGAARAMSLRFQTPATFKTAARKPRSVHRNELEVER